MPAALKPLAFSYFPIKFGENPSQNKSKTNTASRKGGKKWPYVGLNLVQNTDKSNTKQRAPANFRSFIDQLFQVTNNAPVTPQYFTI